MITKPRHDSCACGARKIRYSPTCRRCVPQRRGPDSPAWKGGRCIKSGWVLLYDPAHPRAAKDGYVREHVAVASRVLGKPVPLPAVVHHVDRDRGNNVPSNLVICQDQSYHRLLHNRLDALLACGDPAKRMCIYCKVWSSLNELVHAGEQYRHRDCHAAAVREAKARKRSQVPA
jgi:hypothetical protein